MNQRSLPLPLRSGVPLTKFWRGLPKVASQHDFTIIDGPAGISELTRAILLRADLALVPVQPTGFDIRSAG